MERSGFFTPFRRVALVLFLLCLAAFAYLYLAWQQGLRFLWQGMYIAAPMIGLLCGLGLLRLLVRERMLGGGLRAVLHAVLVLLMVGVFVAGGLLWMLTRVLRSDQAVYVSPERDKRVVVLESGMLEATLHAYPMENPLMYRIQDNGVLSYLGMYRMQGVAVEWLADEALVSVAHDGFRKGEVTNEDDLIHVSFE